MLKFLLTLAAGIYTGIYISQNYEVPRVDEPAKIIEKIKEFADDHRKKFFEKGRQIEDSNKSSQ